jgi:hypothetical protein
MPHMERVTRDPQEIAAILDQAQVCRLGLIDDHQPYVVPMCFAHQDGRIYLHSAGSGRKMTLLRHHPRVCVEVDRLLGLKQGKAACSFGLYYESVIGCGRATIVEDNAEKRMALELLCRRYTVPGAAAITDEALKATTVIRVDLDQLTGKRSR